MSNKNNIKINLIEFNYLRAIGIFLVVLGHSFPYIDEININLYKYVHSLIYSFHMPLFILISGIFAHKTLYIKSLKGYTKFISIKFKRLMIPYFLISALTIPIKLILNKFSERPIVLSEIIKDILLYPWNNPIIFFWFIYVLFLIFLFTPILVKLNKHIVLGAFFILSILPIPNIEFMGISTILKYSIFFFIGLYSYPAYISIRDNILNIKLKPIKSILLIIIPFVIFFMNINIPTSSHKFISLCIINTLYILKSLLGIYVCFIICIFIYKLREIKWISYIFKTLYTYSFDIYLLSWFPQIFVRILLLQILNLNYNLVVIISIISGFTPIIVSKFILRKFKLTKSILLGIT